jgi:hypothetical protein
VLSAIRIRQIERSIVCLKERLRQIELTLDGERLLGFANMCFRYFEAGAKEHREFKLKLLASACAHSAAADNTDPFDVELEVFDAVERLQPFHIRLLHYLQEHYVEPRPGGAHRHIAGASYGELKSANLGIQSDVDIWLLKGFLTLREMDAVYVEDGSGLTSGKEGYARPIVEPEDIVRSGKIGLAHFGCRVLHYVKKAISDDVDPPVSI